jgi:hypothetical protein
MSKINWPGKYRPENTDAHIIHDISADVPAERVWAWLVHPTLWPSYYENASDVEFIHPKGPALALGTHFKWKTFGQTIESIVEEFVPGERISWRAWSDDMDVFHAWLIEKRVDGVYILTEETQIGAPAIMMASQTPNPMHTYHQIWLGNLVAKAREGWPPV